MRTEKDLEEFLLQGLIPMQLMDQPLCTKLNQAACTVTCTGKGVKLQTCACFFGHNTRILAIRIPGCRCPGDNSSGKAQPIVTNSMMNPFFPFINLEDQIYALFHQIGGMPRCTQAIVFLYKKGIAKPENSSLAIPFVLGPLSDYLTDSGISTFHSFSLALTSATPRTQRL